MEGLHERPKILEWSIVFRSPFKSISKLSQAPPSPLLLSIPPLFFPPPSTLFLAFVFLRLPLHPVCPSCPSLSPPPESLIPSGTDKLRDEPMDSSTLTSAAFPSVSPAVSQVVISANPIEHGTREHQEGSGRGCHVKVPANGFLLFRADYKAIQANQVAADGRRKKQTEITKDAAIAWKALPQVVRDDYLARARHNLAEHKREHWEFWSRRRGRDGRFLRVPQGAASSSHGASGQPDGTVRSSPHISDPIVSPSGSPPIPSLDVAPEFNLDSLDPRVSGSSATTFSNVQPLRFHDPFCVGSPFGPPTLALPFHQFPAASPDEHQTVPVPTSSGVDFLPSTAMDTFLHESMQPATTYNHSLVSAYVILDVQGNAFSCQDTDPLQLRSWSTHDLSSRTLTLSRSDWERVDLFLQTSSNSTSGASTPTTNHPVCAAL